MATALESLESGAAFYRHHKNNSDFENLRKNSRAPAETKPNPWVLDLTPWLLFYNIIFKMKIAYI